MTGFPLWEAGYSGTRTIVGRCNRLHSSRVTGRRCILHSAGPKQAPVGFREYATGSSAPAPKNQEDAPPGPAPAADKNAIPARTRRAALTVALGRAPREQGDGRRRPSVAVGRRDRHRTLYGDPDERRRTSDPRPLGTKPL